MRPFSPARQAITHELPSPHKYTRTAALRWISMLLEKLPEDMLEFIDVILEALLNALSDESDEVVKLDVRLRHTERCDACTLTLHPPPLQLEVLARVSLNETQFLRVLKDILRLLCTLIASTVGGACAAGRARFAVLTVCLGGSQLKRGGCWRVEAAS